MLAVVRAEKVFVDSLFITSYYVIFDAMFNVICLMFKER